MTQFSRTPDITSSGDPVGDIAPCHSHAEATLPLKLWLSDDERPHAKADCGSQSDGQQREPHLDMEPHLATLLELALCARRLW